MKWLGILVCATLASFLVACAEPDHTPKPGDATYLVRPGMAAPETAKIKDGDVPRDRYGRPYTYEGLGDPLPDVSGTLIDGMSFSTAGLEGKWTVLKVWGVWCHDSRRDAPFAAALAQSLATETDISFLSIQTPQNAERADKALKGYASVKAWFEEQDYVLPTLVDEDASVRTKLSIRWTPTYLIIAPDLTVQGFRTGLSDAGETAVSDFVDGIDEIRTDWTAAQAR